jgi:signal transduction histidine kinase
MSWRSRLVRWGIILAVWTVVVLLVAGDCYLHSALSAEEDVSLCSSFLWAAPTWYPWALLTPLVLWLAERLRPTRQGWLLPAMALAGSGLVLAALKVVGLWTAETMLAGADLAERLAPQTLSRLLTRRLPVNLGAFAAIVVVSFLAAAFRERRERELRGAQLETQLAVAELRALKMQLHPHFVLNVLNTITAMIPRNPERAEEMTVRLGELLRMVLDTRESHTVPLAIEIEFLEKYLEIEQARFGDQLQVEVEVAEGIGDALVPNLVLQPFVENAIKHRSLRPGTPTVIRVEVKNGRDRLHLRVTDNGPGVASNGEPPVNGLGIANTRARLDALYGDSYQLLFSSAQQSGLEVDLYLPHANELVRDRDRSCPNA